MKTISSLVVLLLLTIGCNGTESQSENVFLEFTPVANDAIDEGGPVTSCKFASGTHGTSSIIRIVDSKGESFAKDTCPEYRVRRHTYNYTFENVHDVDGLMDGSLQLRVALEDLVYRSQLQVGETYLVTSRKFGEFYYATGVAPVELSSVEVTTNETDLPTDLPTNLGDLRREVDACGEGFMTAKTDAEWRDWMTDPCG